MSLKKIPDRKQSRTAVLSRRQPVKVHDVSRNGCRWTGSTAMDVGAVGLLTVDIEGETHVELFRVSRTHPTPAGAYESAVEFLPMPAGTRSLHGLAAELDDSHSS
jgi:hypothetical protein